MRRATINHQYGFSLLEILIGLIITSYTMIMMVQMSAQAASELKAKNLAESMQAFQRIATDYFLFNRTEMLDAMSNTTSSTNRDKHCRINVPASGTGGNVIADPATTHTCTFDTTLMTAVAGLPAGVANNNEARIRWIATFRRIYAADGSPTDNADLLIYGAQTTTNSGADITHAEARIAANIAGGNGGVIFSSNQPGCLATEACGSNGGWKVSLANFGVSKLATPPNPKAMATTIASYTFFPRELTGH